VKKFILGSIILIIVLFVLFLVIGIAGKLQNRKLVSEKIARFPVFSFMTLSNGLYSSLEIIKGPVLVVHFHPECEHCQYEISEILKSNIPASFTNVILISSATPDSIKSFIYRNNYPDYPSVLFLVDTSYNFEDIFGKGIIPSSYIYNRKLILAKVFHGEVKAEAILKYLDESE
jgi:AhpC/TSA family